MQITTVDSITATSCAAVCQASVIGFAVAIITGFIALFAFSEVAARRAVTARRY